MVAECELGIRNSELGISARPPEEKPQITQMDADISAPANQF